MSSHLYSYSAFNNTNCVKATAQYQNCLIGLEFFSVQMSDCWPSHVNACVLCLKAKGSIVNTSEVPVTLGVVTSIMSVCVCVYR